MCFETAEHGQPRPLGRADDLLADVVALALAGDGESFLRFHTHATLASAAKRPQRSSAPLAKDLPSLRRTCFVLVADALALVRFRLAGRPHLGGELADLLLVGARGRRSSSGRARRRSRRRAASVSIGVGVADGQHDRLLVHAGLVADALDLELLLVALRHALDHVGDQAARQAVQATGFAARRRAA